MVEGKDILRVLMKDFIQNHLCLCEQMAHVGDFAFKTPTKRYNLTSTTYQNLETRDQLTFFGGHSV